MAKTKASGPEPDRLKIDANWKEAAQKAMANGKPPASDPTPKKKPPRGKRGGGR